MTLACVLDASAAVRLILSAPAAGALATLIREASLVLAPELKLTKVGQHPVETAASRSADGSGIPSSSSPTPAT